MNDAVPVLTADPGAVPGGSTKSPDPVSGAGPLTGPNQDRRVRNDGIFARPENAVKLFKTYKCQRQRGICDCCVTCWPKGLGYNA